MEGGRACLKQTLSRGMLASGFIFLLSIILVGMGFLICEYDILAKEHDGVYPNNQTLSLEACKKSEDRSIRSFELKQKASTVPILTYHRIIAENDIGKAHLINGKRNTMITTKEDFERQMNYLKENGFMALSLKELYHFLVGELDVPKKSVVITFDDGFKDNYVEAYPILKKHDFTAVNFIITGAITNRMNHYIPKNVQYFSKKELIRSCDIFEFQSHTYRFHKKEEDSRGELDSYLVTRPKKEILEDIRTTIFHLHGDKLGFAYPYGRYSPKTIEVIKELGFKMAFTTEYRAASPKDHLFEIPRYQILSTTTFEQFKEYVEGRKYPSSPSNSR